MQTHADKAQENKVQEQKLESSQYNNVTESTFQFTDNRPDANTQGQLQQISSNHPQSLQMKALQEMANKSPKAMQMKSLQEMANNSPKAMQMKELQEMANNSPKAMQMKELQEIANNSPKAMQMKELKEMAYKSQHASVQQFQTKATSTLPQTVQRQENIEEELLQGKFSSNSTIQKKGEENKTGLPDNLKTGIESLSGYSMNDVKVHYNSEKPAQIQAHAYAQGKDIHLAPGQEKHLPHEAWHVVQQMQGRVNPTKQLKGQVNVNDDAGLEKEADIMGEKAMQLKSPSPALPTSPSNSGNTVQRKAYIGDSLTPSTGNEEEKISRIQNDNIVRRFQDNTELEAFAAGGRAEGMGSMPDGTWVRLPTTMLVLGENHGTPIAPEIIKSTGISKFRYEGFVKIDQQRLDKSEALNNYIGEKNTETLKRIKGIDGDLDEEAETLLTEEAENGPSHAAETTQPKYARTLADVIELVNGQKSGTQVEDEDVTAGRDIGNEYSLVKALLSGLPEALIFCKSYSNKKLSHPLKTFYNENKEIIESAIPVLLNCKKTNIIPNFTELNITEDFLDSLTTIFENKAKKKLKLNTDAKLEKFKNSLNTKDESRVAISDRAKENDYLRDASMLETIKEAKSAGDRLFVIGDAHRKKLAPLISSLGLEVKEDTTFVQEQAELDKNALVNDPAPPIELTEGQYTTIMKSILNDIKVLPGRKSQREKRIAGVDRRITPSLTDGNKAEILEKFGISINIQVEGGELSSDIIYGQSMPNIVNTNKDGEITITLTKNGSIVEQIFEF